MYFTEEDTNAASFVTFNTHFLEDSVLFNCIIFSWLYLFSQCFQIFHLLYICFDTCSGRMGVLNWLTFDLCLCCRIVWFLRWYTRQWYTWWSQTVLITVEVSFLLDSWWKRKKCVSVDLWWEKWRYLVSCLVTPAFNFIHIRWTQLRDCFFPFWCN